MSALSNLPKLESLELLDTFSITNQTFKRFTTLKKITCYEVENMQEGISDLLRNCNNFEEISLYRYSREEITEILRSAAEAFKQRINIDIPFSARIVNMLGQAEVDCKVRMLPVRSKENSTKKILYKIFYDAKTSMADFATYDLNIFVNEVKLLMKECY